MRQVKVKDWFCGIANGGNNLYCSRSGTGAPLVDIGSLRSQVAPETGGRIRIIMSCMIVVFMDLLTVN